MKNKRGFVLSTYVYILLVFFLLLLGTMLLVLNNTRLLSNKMKENTQANTGLLDKDFSIILLGDKNLYWGLNVEFVDPGFIAKSIKGVDLSEYVKVESNVNENVLGSYTITYTITYNGKTRKAVRNVFVNELMTLTIKKVEGETNEVLKKDYVKGSDREVIYEFVDVDISNMTNISCNNGRIPILNNNILNVKDMEDDTTCVISDSLFKTTNNLDNTETNIVMLSNEETSDEIIINENNNVILDLNGKSFSSNYAINNNGNLELMSRTTQGVITTPVSVVWNSETGNLKTQNIKLISTNTDNASAICTDGYVEVNDNSYIEGPFGIGCHNIDSALTIVNDGEIKGVLKNGIQINDSSSANVIVNNAYVYGYLHSVNNLGIDTIELNGGTFIGETSYSAVNYSTGVIEINQTSRPIYITSLAQQWAPAISNNLTGTININGNVANNCTNNSADTISGLCVYAEGDKNYEGNTSNGAVRNSDAGTININGGTYYGGHQGINNNMGGIINIKNGYFSSGNVAILNNSTGTINICNANLSAPYDLQLVDATGKINYSSSVIFTAGTNTPVYRGSNTATSNYTGACGA